MAGTKREAHRPPVDPVTAYESLSVCLHRSGAVHVTASRLEGTSGRLKVARVRDGALHPGTPLNGTDWLFGGLEDLVASDRGQMPLW